MQSILMKNNRSLLPEILTILFQQFSTHTMYFPSDNTRQNIYTNVHGTVFTANTKCTLGELTEKNKYTKRVFFLVCFYQ